MVYIGEWFASESYILRLWVRAMSQIFPLGSISFFVDVGGLKFPTGSAPDPPFDDHLLHPVTLPLLQWSERREPTVQRHRTYVSPTWTIWSRLLRIKEHRDGAIVLRLQDTTSPKISIWSHELSSPERQDGDGLMACFQTTNYSQLREEGGVERTGVGA